MLQEKYERGFIDGARCYSDIDSKSDYWDDKTTKGKLMGGIGVVGISRLKDLELDVISKIGDVKPKSSRLVKRKLIM
jgi:hypothetical protein